MRRRLHRTARWVLVAATMFAAAGCGADGKGDLTVTAKEFSLTTSRRSTDSGTVSIDVDNTGSLEHELVLVQLPKMGAPKTLPTGELDLTANKPVDRLQKFGPGRFKASFLRIQPGRYLLVCNLVTDGKAHFAQGMTTPIDVKATSRDKVAR